MPPDAAEQVGFGAGQAQGHEHVEQAAVGKLNGHKAMQGWRRWARTLECQTLTLYHATRDSRTPWYAKVLAGLVVAYALSPVDLIPDFIPVLGYLDDLILVPLGIWLAVRLIPETVLIDARRRAEVEADRHTSRTAAAVIISIWVAVAIATAVWLYRTVAP